MSTENPGKRHLPFYTGDRQLARRVQEHLDSFPLGCYVDPVLIADDLQQTYRQYGRRKRLAFRKTVQRVCDWVAKQKSKQSGLDVMEQRHLSKRRKQDKCNGEGSLSRQDREALNDGSSDSFSDDSEDYVESKDTNMVNAALSKLYSKGTPSASSSPSPGLKPQTSNLAGTPDTTPGRPPGRQGKADSDGDSMELGNLSMDHLDDGEDVDDAPSRRGREMLLPRTLATEATPIPSGSSTPQTGMKRLKDKKRKSSNQTMMEEESTAKKGRMGQERGRKAKKIVEPQQSTVTFSDVGGNDETLHELCKLLIHMRHPEVYQQLGVTPPRGVLLHGPPGCGKTLLAHAIAGELQLPFLKIAATEIVSGVSGESEGNIRDLFEEAMGLAPCILFLDEIDAITPKRETAQREMERRIVAQLLSCMDELSTSPLHVLVIGATNRADSLDPALRRAGRFDREICLGIPGVKERERILQVLCRNLRLSQDFSFASLSSLTPGYVGADLMSLCREAAMCAVNRIFHDLQVPSENVQPSPISDSTSSRLCIEADNGGENRASQSAQTGKQTSPGTIQDVKEAEQADPKPSYHLALSWLKDHSPLTEEQLDELYIEMKDFEEALPHVQPSAKREGFATIPDVTWDDVGALHSIREELSMAILAPVRNPDAFKMLGLTSPPGILLAGPPGCGKTLLAKAIANESGINFISVKGPELMNMYVGESERAVRQCFHRARNSAPCVIFFDELDALCPKRSDSAESGSSARVVNQLLTEMDGLEARKQVFIVGATNRPDIIDPAVLRPGRLDKTLYVGIPSPEDRVAILKTVTKNGTRPPLADDVILENIGHDDRCDGFSGADLAALVREASMAALRVVLWSVPTGTNPRGGGTERGTGVSQVAVTAADFESAFAKVKASVSKKDRERYRKLRLNALDLSDEHKAAAPTCT
ncbi:nuclear valosin-containing protein-like isoform X2 [Acanthaster planci]|uniref:Nuclear valosin-containing protein-like isoform X2 n=1 Tax=Acanthaster planci TaxID=133434 RepID=A0A8B7YX64_ACAPL|nr:nuclear valosin-containing protein-like isoform X2 [Acanthaster planci]